MKKYKLTTQDLKTHNGFQWEIGKEQTTSGQGELCSSGWLHYYHHPLLAVLLNSIHANIKNPKLFEVKALGVHKNDKGLKGGCTKLTLVKEIELPIITLNQKTVFGILCAKEVYKEEKWNLWADNWLSGKDRTADAAYTAYDAAANDAAYTAAYAAAAANDAAYTAAYAANTGKINIIKIAKQALTYN